MVWVTVFVFLVKIRSVKKAVYCQFSKKTSVYVTVNIHFFLIQVIQRYCVAIFIFLYMFISCFLNVSFYLFLCVWGGGGGSICFSILSVEVP